MHQTIQIHVVVGSGVRGDILGHGQTRHETVLPRSKIEDLKTWVSLSMFSAFIRSSELIGGLVGGVA